MKCLLTEFIHIIILNEIFNFLQIASILSNINTGTGNGNNVSSNNNSAQLKYHDGALTSFSVGGNDNSTDKNGNNNGAQ